MAQTLFPIIRYRDPAAGITFLEDAFGFERSAVHQGPGGTVEHAELKFGDSFVMLGPARDGSPPEPGSAVVYAVVEDADAHHDRATKAGATIVDGLRDTDYGSREYSARDREGNTWSFGTYAPATG
jgi:uncharacterized glyoxalase superfamily protein PhnB